MLLQIGTIEISLSEVTAAKQQPWSCGTLAWKGCLEEQIPVVGAPFDSQDLHLQQAVET